MKLQWSTTLRSPMAILAAAMFAASCAAQEPAPVRRNPEDARYAQLSAKLDQALAVLGDTQRELAESRVQMHDLEMRMQAIDARSSKSDAPVSSSGEDNREAANLQAAVQQLQENTQILQAEVKQHDQIKVESSSKYPIKISGMLLSSTNWTDGAVDNVDLPVVALARNGSVAHGSLATTWRQTLLGLDAQGPSVWGGRSEADVRTDFFGGQPTGGYGTNAGTLRLRTAQVHLDWPNSSLIASLDSPLISPLEPTSFMSIGEPSMAWSGNLWSWSPQIEFKHSIAVSHAGSMGFETGLIDPAATASFFNQALRQANPSESSKQPSYEARLSYALGSGDHALIVGGSGYYGRQTYPYGQHIDPWAGTADWKLPLNKRIELSGELYRGRALGDLGGGTFKDYVPYGTGNEIHGLDAEGGWTQLKVSFSPFIETNAAIGQDSAFSGEVRDELLGGTPTTYSNLIANRTVMGNIIFRPRAYLLFSLEYRKIASWQVTLPTDNSQTLGLAIGYLY